MKTKLILPLAAIVAVLGWQAHAAKSDYICQASFPSGDSIEITSVHRTADQIVVKGRYDLVNHDVASLALYITSTNSSSLHEGERQTMTISKGRGEFELIHPHPVPGLPHVSMYADGKSFAALYFGTKEEAEAEKRLNLGYNAPLSIESAPPVVVKTVPVAGATDVDPALTEIRVTFSKPMQDGSWSWSTWGQENFPEMVGQPKYLPDGR